MPAAPARGFDGDFSFRFYEHLVRSCAARYEVKALREFAAWPEARRPRIYLRHDIDLCPDAALRMGEFEAEIGFSSTYMFIPTSPLYDIRSGEGAATLRRLRDLGHEIAIHFDIATSRVDDPADPDQVSAEIDRQCELISEVTGSPVQSVSFHRPMPAFLGGPDRLGGRVNAYSATLMACYRSDSAGVWRSGNPAEDLPGNGAPVAQLLTHPLWWSREHNRPADRLEEYFLRRTRGMDPAGRARFDALLAETVPRIRRAGKEALGGKD